MRYQPLQPSMAICCHFCKIWTETCTSQTSSGKCCFCRLPIHPGWSFIVVYACVCMLQHILDAAWTIHCTTEWIVHFMRVVFHCFALRVPKIPRMALFVHCRRLRVSACPTLLMPFDLPHCQELSLFHMVLCLFSSQFNSWL